MDEEYFWVNILYKWSENDETIGRIPAIVLVPLARKLAELHEEKRSKYNFILLISVLTNIFLAFAVMVLLFSNM